MTSFLFTLLSCGAREPNTVSRGTDVPPNPAPQLVWEEDDSVNGLKVDLKDHDFSASGPSTVGGTSGSAKATTLSAKATEALLARLPTLEAEPGDQTPFAKRADSKPPPRTGVTVQQPWPPPIGDVDAPDIEVPALEVRRFSPEGDIPLAPHLSVTFNQPMVGITSHDEASKTVPVNLTPNPAGHWRWAGTKTLLFDPAPRFPMSSDFSVEVPAGVTSVAGKALAEPVKWTFSTPTIKMVTQAPLHGPHGLEPLIAIAFNQRVVPEDILATLRLQGNNESWALTGAEPSDLELADNRHIRNWTADLDPDRFVLAKPTRPLTPGTSYSLTLPKGSLSAEGPKPTPTDQSYSFRTYDPLQFHTQNCSWGVDGCAPHGAWTVTFNNEIDVDAFAPSAVSVQPALDDMKVTANGRSVVIQGKSQSRTTYTVNIDSLADVYGQQLAEPVQREFKVGYLHPQLIGPNKDLVVVDPTTEPTLSVYAVNYKRLKMRAFQVTPEDYAGVSEWMRKARYDGFIKGEPPGKKVFDGMIPVEGFVPDTRIEVGIDLEPHLGAKRGQLFVWIEAPNNGGKNRWERIELFHWVQATNIGLTAAVDQDELVVMATTLADGRPIEDLTLSLLGQDREQKTDAQGMARIAKYDLSTGPHALVASKGSDLAMLPSNTNWWNESGNWTEWTPADTVRWFVFDDRAMYRPKEEMRVKGWLRSFDNRPGGQLEALDQIGELTWRVMDSQGNEIGKGATKATDAGGFDVRFELPDTPNLGHARMELSTSTSSGHSYHTHSFQIQEFRRPEFEVTTTMDPGPYILGDVATVTANGAYYAGGALPNADVHWRVNWDQGAYVPPNWSAYRFGQWTPWWRHWRGTGQTSGSAQHSGVTDSRGSHAVDIGFLALNPPMPMNVTASATIVDVNRQQWSSSETLTLHPAAVYVGVKPDQSYYDEGDSVALDVVVVDLEGNTVSGVNATVGVHPLDWARRNGQWQEVEGQAVHVCEPKSSKQPSQCEWEAERGGRYRVKAEVADAEGRRNRTQFEIWVSGGPLEKPPSRDVQRDDLVLVPDGDSYQPGDVAKILVQAPFFPAEGMLQTSRNGELTTQRFTMTEATHTLEIPIVAAHTPQVTVAVEVVGAAERKDDEGQPLAEKAPRVAFAGGSLNLPVPPLAKTLAVGVTPQHDAVAPGGESAIDVQVTDAEGNPVAEAEVAIWAVDEAVLGLTGYQRPDPLTVFYAHDGSGVVWHHLRHHVVLANPEEVGTEAFEDDDLLQGNDGYRLEDRLQAVGYAAEETSFGGAKWGVNAVASPPAPSRLRNAEAKKDRNIAGAGGGGTANQPITLREDFSAIALFSPRAQTDAQGRVTVPLALPDSLTRYRIMAVAVTNTAFGGGENTITVRKPLMLRPSPPRFLNFGDQAEVPLVIQNQGKAPLSVKVALRASNARMLGAVGGDEVGSQTGRQITVPANDRVEVRIPVTTQMAGKARFQAVVDSGRWNDAASFDFPVWTPATGEAYATYGELDDGAVLQPVEAPSDVWTEFGGLEVTTASTTLQALTDAVLYLANYPYDCSEQIASRVLAIAALRDVLDAFSAAELPTPEQLEATVKRDLDRLTRRQQNNGGWGYWGRTPTEPYLTVHVYHTLLRAKEKGYAIDQNVLRRAQRYVENVESYIPGYYSRQARWSIIAYSVFARHLAGDDDLKKARRLLKEAGVDTLNLEAQGWLLPTLHNKGASEVATLLRHWDNRATETAAGAQFSIGYKDTNDYVLLHSSRRTDAVLLESLIRVKPGHDLIPKVVRSLLGHRVRGRWSTTQENSFVLLAMDRYFRTYEAETPDFVARLWLGDAYAGEQAFKGRETERKRLDIPMRDLAAVDGTQDLVLQKTGAGRLYYRIGMRYAPKSLLLEPADHGFEVTRRYEAIDDPDDVRLDNDNTWHIKAGARVKVHLEMIAPSRRTHVALVDPLPAGLEAQNPALEVTATEPVDATSKGGYWWWGGAWYQHQNLRDERVEAFTTLLWDGVHSYSYTALATTPGDFVAPPAKAEEMYHPETFGRSGSDRVIIE